MSKEITLLLSKGRPFVHDYESIKLTKKESCILIEIDRNAYGSEEIEIPIEMAKELLKFLQEAIQ